MDLELQWKKNSSAPSSYHAKLNVQSFSHVSVDESERHLDKLHLEGFCTEKYYVTVTYDSKPLTRVRIAVIKPILLRTAESNGPKAHELIYKWFREQRPAETLERHRFSVIDKFTSETSIEFSSEGRASGVTFRIELDDDSLLERNGESKFYVGSGRPQSCYLIEIPFSWPLERQIQSDRIMSLYRPNLFWLQPQLGCRDLKHLMHETSFVLVGPGEGENRWDDNFVSLMLASDSEYGFRVTLFGTGTYPAMRIEGPRNMHPSIETFTERVLCYLGCETDPLSAIRTIVEACSSQTSTFSSRSYKLESAKFRTLSTIAKTLSCLGYCTWDAVGHNCSEEYITTALTWLKEKKIPVGYVIIDDGWQDGGHSGPLTEDDEEDRPSPKLASFQANDKFSKLLRRPRGKETPAVYVWMTIIGYWGGVDGKRFKQETIPVRLQASIGLHRNQAGEVEMWEREYEIIAPPAENLEHFFTDYFKHLSAQGVTGVKIDGQSILGSFTTSEKDVSALVGKYRDALRRAAERVFPDEVILNCMACAPEVVLESGQDLSVSNICWRTSDDHSFPGVEETNDMIAWHVLRNAMNSLFLGEIFPVTDWDMLRISDKNAYMDAIARVLSGGPIYFSDFVPLDGKSESKALKLIRRLTTYEGQILRCQDPGRPTVDCIFGDPREGKMFKIFNRNAVSGLVGLFNLTFGENGHRICGTYGPSDVGDLQRGTENGYISVVIGETWRCAFRHDSSFSQREIALWPMEAAIAHIFPILCFTQELDIAVIGRLDLLNCSGVVRSVSAWRTSDNQQTIVEISLADYGKIAVWLGEKATSRLKFVNVCNVKQDLTFMNIDELSFVSVTVPKPRAEGNILMRLSFDIMCSSR